MPEYLKNIHHKLVKKTKLSVEEELLSLNKLKKYFKDFKAEYNSYVYENIDWTLFDNRKPFDFQKEGVKFLILNDKCILADDMGLGKSIQSIMASKVLPDEYNILIVTLKTLKFNFEEEIGYFDDRISIIDKKWNPNKYTIIHYNSVKQFEKQIIEAQFDVIILDECHKIKNPKAKRTEIFIDIFKKTKKEIKKIWLLTGTPLDNRPMEYFQLLKIIDHPLSKDWVSFVKTYCNGYQDMFGHWNTSGATNLDDLYKKTKGSILRRVKKQVLKNFPEKTRTTISLKLDNESGYKKALQDFADKRFLLEKEDNEEIITKKDIQYQLEQDFFNDSTPIISNYKNKGDVSKLEVMTKIMIYRQWCAIEKINDGSTLELIENEIDKSKKVIIFTNFTAVIDKLKDKLGNICLTLDGRVKIEDRKTIVHKFNKEESYKVFVVNFEVGSTGLNLQSSDVIIMNDLPWMPSVILQGEDRIYRIGQINDCRILYPYYKNTVEEKVFQTIIKKVNMIAQILDGKAVKFVDDIDLPPDLAPTKKEIIKEIVDSIDNFGFYF